MNTSMGAKEKDASEREQSDKTRRKASASSGGEVKSTNSNGGGSLLINPAHARDDVYANVVQFEVQETEHRSAEGDSDMFHRTCADLRTLFADVAHLKMLATTAEAAARLQPELAEKRIEGSYLFVLMKKLNRMDKIRLRSGRDALHKEKLAVDSNRLQLQNLLYEAEHLRKEVQRCLQFKSQDEDIDLVSEAEFYAEAPVEISQPEKTEKDQHAKRLARLDWELQQRKELSALCEQHQKQKEIAAQHIDADTNRLESLAPRLDALLKATRPLQEALNLHMEDEWKVNTISRLLPPPLYMAYANLRAYESCGQWMSATINGDEFEARQLSADSEPMAESRQSISTPDEDERMESDNEDDERRPAKSHHHRRQSLSSQIEQMQQNLFKPHPLSVTVRFQSPITKDAPPLSVTLYHLTTLNIITAKCDVQQGVGLGSEVICSNTMLSALAPNDLGSDSPNPKTNFQFRELGLEPATFGALLQAQDLGRPYRWAQEICGLDFVRSTAGGMSLELTQMAVPKIAKRIRVRWQNRLELCAQIVQLNQLKASVANSNSSVMLKWSPLTWQAFTAYPAATRFIDEGVASSADLFYSAGIVRGSIGRLECAVRVSWGYPREAPIWAVTLHHKGHTWTAESNACVREIEAWINAVATTQDAQSSAKSLLEQQLRRAQSCLDIYLETNGDKMRHEKTFLRAFRCRTRSRPLKAVQTGGSVVYTQI